MGCRVGLQNWKFEWDQQKQMRCCAKGFPSCPAPEQALAQGPVDPYNCALGDLNWQAGWSTEKKQWCCQIHGKGCGHDEPATANMYDCETGTENWVKGWSQNNEWCCSKGYHGCPSDAATVAGAGYGAALMVVRHLSALQLQSPHRDLFPMALDVEVARSFGVGAEL